MLVGVLFLTGLPVTMLLVPIYEMYVAFNWLNSPFWTSLVLASTSVPFAIWLLKNFIDQVPREFEEAAAIEGSGELRTLMARRDPAGHAGRAGLGDPDLHQLLGRVPDPAGAGRQPGDTPGAVGIYQFLDANAQVQFGPLAAYSILFSIPVLVLYLISSRWLQGGFAFAGGIKG